MGSLVAGRRSATPRDPTNSEEYMLVLEFLHFWNLDLYTLLSKIIRHTIHSRKNFKEELQRQKEDFIFESNEY